MELLFSYGTLQREDVQLATFGHTLEGQSDVLIGYRLRRTRVRDAVFARANGLSQRTLEFTGDASHMVPGTAFRVTQEELEQSDKYEPTDYVRRKVKLKSGVSAWTYLQSPNDSSLRSDE